MVKRRLLTMIVLLGFLLSPFNGSQPFFEVSAETGGPPSLSSEGFEPPDLPNRYSQPAIVPGPVRDDYIPAAEDLPVIQTDGFIPQQVLQGGTDSDSQQKVDLNASGVVLYDNGPLVTHPGGGFNGNDASVLQTALGLSTYGLNCNSSGGYRIADEFEVRDPEGWQVETLTFFAYQTETYPYPPASTLTAVYLQIWKGQPGAAGSTVIFGDMVTDRMLSTSWPGIYRVLDTDLLGQNRPIMAIEAQVGKMLAAGTYWLDWGIDGSSPSGPWATPISVLGQTTTGNALQTSDGGTSWHAANDTGTTTQQGMPFVIRGNYGSLLWDQPLSTTDSNAYVNQEFPDYPASSTYLADDFIVQNSWMVQSIFVPGRGWNDFTTLMNATQLTWKIYADNGGIPAGDPSGGGSAPIWSLSLTPTDSRVIISNGTDGLPSDTLLSFPTPLILPPGHYWLVFYPTMTFDPFGQFGLQPAETMNGNMAQFINPGGGFGFGTLWQDWTILVGVTQHDISFSIGGKILGNWKSIAAINSAGRSRPAAATVNGKIYLMGGEISGGRANTVERYDPQTNTWTTRSGLMQFPASNICAAAIGTNIYVPGGYDATAAYLNTLQVYNTVTDSWSTVTTDPLPLPLYGVGCAALNGKLYVFGGGTSGPVYQNASYVYDPLAAAGSRWTTLASMSIARQFIGGAAVGGKIYAVGGYNSSNSNLPAVEAYDPADGLWHTVTNLNFGRSGAGAYSVGNSLFVCGGGYSIFYRTCEVFDTSQGYGGWWDDGPSLMLQGRRTFAYVNIGPVLYAIAGYNGSYLTTAERWSFETYMPMIRK